MTKNQEIKLLDKVQKLIKEKFGKPCKEFNIECPTCKAYLVHSWIDNYLDLFKIERSIKNFKAGKRASKKTIKTLLKI